MEVKKHKIHLVKMAMTAYLQLCHLECIRCLLTREEVARFGDGCWAEMKTSDLSAQLIGFML